VNYFDWLVHFKQINTSQVKNVYPVTCHESTDGEKRYSFALSLTLALDAGGWLTPLHLHLRDPVSIQQEAESSSWPVLMGV
jgi:hypothetical protein